jgi:hypothetical protein
VTAIVTGRHKTDPDPPHKLLIYHIIRRAADLERGLPWGRKIRSVMNPLLQETAAGRDWQIATLAHRQEFCARMRTFRPDEVQLLRSLDALLGGHTGAGRDLRLTEAVAMVVQSWPDPDRADGTDRTRRE